MNNNSRRNFLKKIAVGTLSAPLTKIHSFGNYNAGQKKIKRGKMYYRRLGRTDMFISEISLGASPLPDWALLMQAIERGVNYIDTSHTYSNGNSERQIGKLFKEFGRDKLYMGTKFHLRRNWSEKTIIQSAEDSLKRLQSDYIDVLLIHGAEEKKNITDERVLSALDKLKTAGKIRFQGLSCHSNHKNVIETAVDCGHYDMVLLGYNVFDIEEKQVKIETYDDYLGESGLRSLISYAAVKDVGIIAMKTLKIGGKRQNLENYKTGTTSIFQAMLKWVLENKNIASACTEMLNQKQLDEDLAVPGQSLTKNEKRTLFKYVAENGKDFCHMCGQCQTQCPSGIATTDIMRFLAYYEGYNKTNRAKKEYTRLNPEQTGKECKNCGQCESICPYNVAVRERINYAHSLLTNG